MEKKKLDKSELAARSLGLGVISLIAWFNTTVGASVSSLGIIFGVMGLKSENKNLAIKGIMLSAIGLAATIIYSHITHR